MHDFNSDFNLGKILYIYGVFLSILYLEKYVVFFKNRPFPTHSLLPVQI